MYRKDFNYIDFVNRVEKILELIESKPNNFKHIFTELFDKDFKSQLTFIEKLNNGSLKGLIISIKDLFDVKGYKTRGGSIFFWVSQFFFKVSIYICTYRKKNFFYFFFGSL